MSLSGALQLLATTMALQKVILILSNYSDIICNQKKKKKKSWL